MTEGNRTAFPSDRIDGLLATAARAPSILNTQPWLFKVSRYTIELYSDPRRKLRADVTGREMLISCGAALFGLRLAVRSIGYLPVVRLLPDPDSHRLLATVRLGAKAPMAEAERRMFEALPHRHTHRGPFTPVPLPRGLLIGLQHDAVAERAELALIDRAVAHEQLASIVAQAARNQNLQNESRADVRQWVREPGTSARDGVPAQAFAARPMRQPENGTDQPAGQQAERWQPGWFPQRDLDLGRGIGLLPPDGPPPAATAVLMTPGDTKADWIRAGQALHRLLAHAAMNWVFASLNSQPFEAAPIREMIRARLGLTGSPQLIMQLGVARVAPATARRPPADLIERNRSRPGRATDKDVPHANAASGFSAAEVRPEP